MRSVWPDACESAFPPWRVLRTAKIGFYHIQFDADFGFLLRAFCVRQNWPYHNQFDDDFGFLLGAFCVRQNWPYHLQFDADLVFPPWRVLRTAKIGFIMVSPR